MSWQACAWLDDLPYDIAERLETRVLLKLCNVADEKGERAYRSKSEVARELGCDPKSVQRALRKLQDLDLIKLGDQRLVAHLRGGYRPTVYDLNFGYARMYAQPEIDFAPEADNDPPDEGGQGYPQAPAEGTLGGMSGVPLGTKEQLTPTDSEEPYVGNRGRVRAENDASGAPGAGYALVAAMRCSAKPPRYQDRRHTFEHGSVYCTWCGETKTNYATGEIA